MSEAPLVLDASALLALLHAEPGADRVAEALSAGAHISTVNWAEVLTKLDEVGRSPADVVRDLEEMGVLPDGLKVHVFDELLARSTAELARKTRTAGLSLADRACLALCSRLGGRVLTADRQWAKLELGFEITLIR